MFCIFVIPVGSFYCITNVCKICINKQVRGVKPRFGIKLNSFLSAVPGCAQNLLSKDLLDRLLELK